MPVLPQPPRQMRRTRNATLRFTRLLPIQRVGWRALSVFVVLIAALATVQNIGAGTRSVPIPPTATPEGRTSLWERFAADQRPPEQLSKLGLTPCVAGMAGIYPCEKVDLLAFMPLVTIGGGSGNDIWGWTDPQDGREYAIMGRTTGAAFVDLSDPQNPVYLGNLPSYSASSPWRDIKVYANHAFIVSEANMHGMQVFDLTALRSVASPPVTFTEDGHYDGFGSAHNLVINEDSGFAYAVGTDTCSGGLHMIDISTPTNPVNAGCFSSDGYTHDAQCVNYTGPDLDYQGSEICFNANEDTLTLVDVSNKSSPVQISRIGYLGNEYAHQGWITSDHRHFLLDDELDEVNNGTNTRTFIWDVTNLDLPTVIGVHTGSTTAIDHNQYIHDSFTHQANYRSGLRILDIADISNGNLSEVAFFDIYPSDDNASFNGAWSVYPFFDSGVIVVSGIEQGLFILQPRLGTQAGLYLDPPSQSLAGNPGQTVTHTLSLTNTGTLSDTFDLTLAGYMWPTNAPATTGNLLPGQTLTFDVTVDIPALPASGVIIATDRYTLTAQSNADPGVSALSIGITHANVLPGAQLSPDQAQTGSWGDTLDYTFIVTNTGNYTDTFAIEASGLWTTTLSTPSTPDLPPGGNATFTLTVHLPAFPNPASSDVTTVLTRSSWDSSILAQATATSDMVVFPMQLPWVAHE